VAVGVQTDVGQGAARRSLARNWVRLAEMLATDVPAWCSAGNAPMERRAWKTIIAARRWMAGPEVAERPVPRDMKTRSRMFPPTQAGPAVQQGTVTQRLIPRPRTFPSTLLRIPMKPGILVVRVDRGQTREGPPERVEQAARQAASSVA
jgi:hypothetical protein